MSEPVARTRRMGKATIALTALLCIVTPIPGLTQSPTDCGASLSGPGHAAVVVWIVSGILLLISVAADLARGRLWSLVAPALCVIVTLIGIVLVFARSPICF